MRERAALCRNSQPLRRRDGNRAARRSSC